MQIYFIYSCKSEYWKYLLSSFLVYLQVLMKICLDLQFISENGNYLTKIKIGDIVIYTEASGISCPECHTFIKLGSLFLFKDQIA